MTERISIGVLALLALLSLWVAPWATLNREIGARGTVLLLPERVIDFTGRTAPVDVSGQGLVLVLSAAALAVAAAAAALRGRARYLLWLLAGLTLITTTIFGWQNVSEAVAGAQVAALRTTIEDELADPRARTDVAALEEVLEQLEERPLSETLSASGQAGLRIRQLPYSGTSLGLAGFLCVVVGGLTLLFGLRLSPRLSRSIDQALRTVAVPATSILLALLAAAVVVLILQPTPLGRDVTIEGPFMYLVGRLDTLWHAYLTLFADSLGTLPGFLEALKFTTPLIFTGLAVAFSFQAGLFNIGAPGQMVLGAIFAMLVGVYLPGPTVVVLPLAVAAAALGGGLWGALPGWLKARYGANEVINTILLNYIAASLLLFILSNEQVFAAPALRMMVVILVFAVIAVIANLIPPLRKRLRRAPRLSAALTGVLLLAALVVAGVPRPGDAPIDLALPFKVPGSEPKSAELSESARLAQVPVLLGIDLAETPGTNTVPVNYAALLAAGLGLLAVAVAPRLSRRLRGWGRLVAALVVAGLAYLAAALLGWAAVDTAVPPTQLNTSFLIALAAAVFVYYLLWRTKWGYELRAVGVSPEAAEYGGASIARNTVMA
ncbi:MAG: hypothetical protein U5L04_13925, partial [Trueperaceae bacterium]|nr:hypothetical protein [Trueperaceae bacterium]